jgi:hypothetical protein
MIKHRHAMNKILIWGLLVALNSFLIPISYAETLNKKQDLKRGQQFSRDGYWILDQYGNPVSRSKQGDEERAKKLAADARELQKEKDRPWKEAQEESAAKKKAAADKKTAAAVPAPAPAPVPPKPKNPGQLVVKGNPPKKPDTVAPPAPAPTGTTSPDGKSGNKGGADKPGGGKIDTQGLLQKYIDAMDKFKSARNNDKGYTTKDEYDKAVADALKAMQDAYEAGKKVGLDLEALRQEKLAKDKEKEAKKKEDSASTGPVIDGKKVLIRPDTPFDQSDDSHFVLMNQAKKPAGEGELAWNLLGLFDGGGIPLYPRASDVSAIAAEDLVLANAVQPQVETQPCPPEQSAQLTTPRAVNATSVAGPLPIQPAFRQPELRGPVFNFSSKDRSKLKKDIWRFRGRDA